MSEATKRTSPAAPVDAPARELAHPDLLSRVQACHYLKLVEACGTLAAAENRLSRFVTEGKVMPIRWARAFLYSKPQLDAFVQAELAALDVISASDADGQAPPRTQQRRSEAV